jgi:hypothetical protein
MSFWARVGVKITDLECFKSSCGTHDIEYIENTDRNFRMGGNEVVATLVDKKASHANQAYLVRKMGAIQIYMDTDARYSSINKRLGRNGGKLGRDYSQNVVRKEIMQAGGMVTSVQEQPDGSLILKAGRAA